MKNGLENDSGSKNIIIPFSEIEIYLEKLKDHESAIQTTVYIASTYPCGIDRIRAYRTALAFAENWKDNFVLVNSYFLILG